MTNIEVNYYPRETVEPHRFMVRDGATVITEGVKVALTDYHTRPSEWGDPVALNDGGMAVLIDALDPALWRVWGKVTGLTGEIEPVVDCGYFVIT